MVVGASYELVYRFLFKYSASAFIRLSQFLEYPNPMNWNLGLKSTWGLSVNNGGHFLANSWHHLVVTFPIFTSSVWNSSQVFDHNSTSYRSKSIEFTVKISTYFQTIAFSDALYFAFPFKQINCTPDVFNGVGIFTSIFCPSSDGLKLDFKTTWEKHKTGSPPSSCKSVRKVLP